MNHTKHFVVGSWLPCTDREALGLVQGRVYSLPRLDSNQNTEIQSLMSYQLDDRAKIYSSPHMLLYPLIRIFNRLLRRLTPRHGQEQKKHP